MSDMSYRQSNQKSVVATRFPLRNQLLSQEFVKIFYEAQYYNHERTYEPCEKYEFEEAHKHAKRRHA
jgi:hypothetical protein